DTEVERALRHRGPPPAGPLELADLPPRFPHQRRGRRGRPVQPGQDPEGQRPKDDERKGPAQAAGARDRRGHLARDPAGRPRRAPRRPPPAAPAPSPDTPEVSPVPPSSEPSPAGISPARTLRCSPSRFASDPAPGPIVARCWPSTWSTSGAVSASSDDAESVRIPAKRAMKSITP